MRSAALNTGPEFHALDHIAPIASLLQIPLIVAEERNYEIARRYYQQIEIRHMPELELQLGVLAEEFDALFECKYWAPHLKSLFLQCYGKEMRLVFCPHGQSDKGFKAPLLAPYASQDAVLLYGELLIGMLKDLNIWPSISNYAIVGNYRLQFYQKHKSFYDELINKEIPLNKKNRTLLYAPTWRDAEDGSSFFQYGASVIDQLPPEWNLIVKVHPLLEQRDPAYFYSIASRIEKKSNAILIQECPLVYPLLSLADFYLGDSSSVGYDFLYFGKPLYFFPTNHPGRLRSCGQIVDPLANIYSQLETTNSFKERQSSLYRLAFGNPIDESELRSRIETAIR